MLCLRLKLIVTQRGGITERQLLFLIKWRIIFQKDLLSFWCKSVKFESKILKNISLAWCFRLFTLFLIFLYFDQSCTFFYLIALDFNLSLILENFRIAESAIFTLLLHLLLPGDHITRIYSYYGWSSSRTVIDLEGMHCLANSVRVAVKTSQASSTDPSSRQFQSWFEIW